MRALGILDKMPTSFINPVQYFLTLGADRIAMNELVGREITLRWTHNIYCTVCGKKTNKSFGEGMCYPCFATAPENSECIVRPELCRAHLGQGRDAEWENKHHNRPHYVYLALTNAVKVGVTREDQIPTRWIDQGAHKGVILVQAPYRQIAGLVEVALKEHLSDKTNWQRMLKNESAGELELLSEKKRVAALLAEEYHQYLHTDDEVVEIIYPVLEYPAKVASISLDKIDSITLPLKGIRGQYLMFEGGNVINIRKHSGYEVELIVN